MFNLVYPGFEPPLTEEVEHVYVGLSIGKTFNVCYLSSNSSNKVELEDPL